MGTGSPNKKISKVQHSCFEFVKPENNINHIKDLFGVFWEML
jgi:hypothetical protein